MTSTKRTDRALVLLSFVIIGLSTWWMSASGVFDFALYNDEKLTWHLIRSSGLVAYLLLTASTVWGLFLSSQIVKDWSPGSISMTLHSTLSWLALTLSLVHGLLLLFDDYFTYALSDIFIPFSGPYRPEFVGLGTLAFWIVLIVTLSFPVRKWIGHKIWKRLHFLSYGAYILVTLHGLMAGTDGEHLGYRLLSGLSVGLVVLLLGMRFGKAQTRERRSGESIPARQKRNQVG